MSDERLTKKQKAILKIMFELEVHKQLFLIDIVPNTPIASGLINLTIKYYKYKMGEVLYNEGKKIEKNNEMIQSINFNLFLKTYAEAVKIGEFKKSELNSVYRSLANLNKKGFIEKDYLLTKKGLEIAKSLL